MGDFDAIKKLEVSASERAALRTGLERLVDKASGGSHDCPDECPAEEGDTEEDTERKELCHLIALLECLKCLLGPASEIKTCIAAVADRQEMCCDDEVPPGP